MGRFFIAQIGDENLDNFANVETSFGSMLSGDVSTMESTVICNQRGEIAGVSPTFEHHFGFRRHELLGQSITKIIPDRYVADHLTAFERVRKDIASAKHIGKLPIHKLQTHAVHKDGTEKEVEITLGALMLTSRVYFTAIIKILGG